MRSTAGSDEGHIKKQPKRDEQNANIQELMQELRDEKAQLRAENRELKAKLDEVLVRLASTGVDGDHYEQDVSTGQYVLYPRTFATGVGHQLGLCRHPWNATAQLIARAEWDNVSGDANLCFWRCLAGVLANEGHSDAFMPPEMLKKQVLVHAIQRAGRLVATFKFKVSKRLTRMPLKV
eukprot:1011343-Amphidinium_carterae.3